MKSRDGIVRVGGVGTGRIFQWAHLNPYPRLWAKARLVGFHDTDHDRAAEAMDKYRQVLGEYAQAEPAAAEAVAANIAELRVYDSLEAMLDNVDAIDVCTHSRGRAPTALAALDAGVHTMVEKPMARTWIEADRIARAFAERPEVIFQLNDDNVFEPKYRAVHDLIARGAIGRPQTMTLIRGSQLSSTSVLKAQADGMENGGGCLMDYGSHGLAGAWYALGTHLAVRKVEAVSIGVLHRDRVLEGDPFVMEVEDNARIKVLLEDPATGAWATIFLEASWCGGHIGPDEEKNGAQGAGYLSIVGDEGVIDATGNEQIRVTRCDGGETVVPLKVYPGETVTFNHEIEAFVDAVRAGTPAEVDAQFGA
ncbi:hypothetical protein LCGC14_2046940, partial [marine sediment metagenome]